MSYIKFHLNNPRKEKEAYIRARIKLNPGSYYEFFLTGEKIEPVHWNPKSNRARKTYPDHRGLNHYLDRMQIHFNNIRRDLQMSGKLNKHMMVKHVDKFFNKSSFEVFEIFEQLAKEKDNNPAYSESIGRKYRNVIQKLKEFDPSTTFESISIDYLMRWISYLYAEHDLSPNTVSRYLNFLRTMLNQATERGFNSNKAYKSKSISVKGTNTLYPFLSIGELDRIYNFKTNNQKLENARIGLLKGCYSGLRHSDWHRLKLDKKTVINGREYYVVSNQKTRNIVHIPAFPKLQEIVDRPYSPASLKNTNPALKTLCKEVGINQPWTKYTYKKNVEKVVTIPKYDAISTHIGRRSFACNSYIAGVPKNLIMKVGGWKTEKSFNKYLQLSSVDGMEHFDNVF